MSLDADTIVDRRRMRRKLTFWRVLAVLIGIGAIVAISAVLRVPGTGILTGQDGPAIARVSITGLIRSDQERVEALEGLARAFGIAPAPDTGLLFWGDVRSRGIECRRP